MVVMVLVMMVVVGNDGDGGGDGDVDGLGGSWSPRRLEPWERPCTASPDWGGRG